MFQNKLTDNNIKYNTLKQLENNFKEEFNLTPCLGAELEFYLLNLKFEAQLQILQKNCPFELKKEKGNNQYEIEISPSTAIASYPETIRAARRLIEKQASENGLKAEFAPKPFLDDFGSSMHIHFNFLEDTNLEKYAEILCHYLPETLEDFLPQLNDYQRLDHRFMAPTHISYGGNNRTTLIRIPDSYPRRLEHRLASASADPYKVIYAILSSIYKGLKNPAEVKKLKKTHGNAYDPQYGLAKISK